MTKTTVPTCFWPSRTPSQNSLAPVTPPPKTPDVDEPDGPQKDPVGPVDPIHPVDPEVIDKERGLMASLLTDLGWLANY